MKEETSFEEFGSALLAQDAWLSSGQLDEHRRQLIERLGQAAQREKRARRLLLFAWAAGTLIFAILCVFGAREAGATAFWPDWVRYALALVFILTPLTMLLLFAIYLFRYRLEVVKAKRQARQEALQELPRRLEQLRRELDELKMQARAEKPPQGSPTNPNSGFTLLEALVVIAILGLLSAMLLPALSRAKSRARTIACKNSLSQMGKAVGMYEADFHCFPGAGDAVVPTNQPPYTLRSPDSWMARLLPYLSASSNVLSCPEDQKPPAPYSRVSGYPAPYHTSFGYNACGSWPTTDLSHHLGLGHGKGDYVSLASITAPADMVAFGDLQVPPGLAHYVISPWHKKPVGAFDSVIPARHETGANMVFVDSHVEWAKQSHWIAETDRARERWNNDHQPHPETW
jgi:prepilin-type N-terminal cleavage/methylation domain-containing protein/prepilin-type processing-associated H-X9-DG protein